MEKTNKKGCKYPECMHKHYSRGYCRNHFQFLLRNKLEPTPENVELVLREKNKKISEKMKEYNKKINKPFIFELEEKNKMEIITLIVLIKTEIEMYEKGLLEICKTLTKEEITSKIETLKLQLKILENIMGKKDISDIEIQKIREELGIVKVGNSKGIQTRL